MDPIALFMSSSVAAAWARPRRVDIEALFCGHLEVFRQEKRQ